MRYVVYQGNDLRSLAKQLLHQRIYDDRGDELLGVWERVAETGTNKGRKVLVVVACELEKGSAYFPHWTFYGALVYEINRSHIQLYVKPENRRQGVGSALISRLRDFENYDRRVISAYEGYPGSEHFFERNLIFVPDCTFGEKELKDTNAELARAGKLKDLPQPYYGDAVRVILQRRKRAFLQKVLKAQQRGEI